MTFADLRSGTAVFLDSNTLVYHFISEPRFGVASTDLLERIEQGDLSGYTSAHVLSEMTHRLMTVEACLVANRASQGIVLWLRNHPSVVQQLTRYRQAIDEVNAIPIQVLPITGPLLSRAADLSRQFGLLTNDALIVAVMQDHGLVHLASNDADFDRVPGISRYAPS